MSQPAAAISPSQGNPISLLPVSQNLSADRAVQQWQISSVPPEREEQGILQRIWNAIVWLFELISSYFGADRSAELEPLANYGFSQVDCTYRPQNPDAIDDIAFANAEHGFGYILDGTGHGSESMGRELRAIMREFNQTYLEAFPNAFETLDDARAFVERQLVGLATKISTHPTGFIDYRNRQADFNDPTYHPAISFVQIIKIGEERHLLSVQKADCSILIKTADDQVITMFANNPGGAGIGANNGRIQFTIKATPLQRGDEIIGFSDGIGEFLTQEQTLAIVQTNQNPATLLREFKKEILTIGKAKPLEILNHLVGYHNENTNSYIPGYLQLDDFSDSKNLPKDLNTVGRAIARVLFNQEPVNGRDLKYHDYDRSNDDIGLFVLRAN